MIFGESFIINSLNGIIYPENLFTNSSTLNRINKAFELSRNCFIYNKINLNEWKKLNDEEEKKETIYNKYIPFNTFLGQTNYYFLILEDPSLEYIEKIYIDDQKTF